MLYADQPRQDVASLLENMGRAHLCLGNSSKSLPYFEQALEVKKVLYGNKPCEDIAISPQYIGSTYIRIGNFYQSLHYYEQALAMREALYTDKPCKNESVSRLIGLLQDIGTAYETIDRVC